MKNIIFRNGLIGGIIASVVMAGMAFYMKSNPENEPNPILVFPCMLLAFYFVVLAIKQKREINAGSITFGKAFATGLLVSLIISTLYVVVWLIIYYNFFPNFMEHYSEIVLKSTKPEDLASKTEELNQMKEWYKNPLYIILLTYAEILPLGIVVSLVSALIFKKK